MLRRLTLLCFVFIAACGNKTDKLQPTVDSGAPPLPQETCIDSDGDGAPGTGDCSNVPGKDCNDNDPMTFPGAHEICDGADNDCNGQIDEALTVSIYYQDADGDGIGGSTQLGEGCAAPPQGAVLSTGDCNDHDSKVRPGAAEICNDADDDCDGVKDNGLPFTDFYPDFDGDGFGDASATLTKSCQTLVNGQVANSSDCNDRDPTVKPTATELCNKVDDNCDGQVDNGVTFQNYYPDVDGDGYGSASATAESSCSAIAGKVVNNTDCNDSASTVKPGAPETCNAVDDNCNGSVDEGLTFQNYYVDVDGDGYGATGTLAQSSCLAIAGRATNASDCNDNNPTVKPGAPELCNAVDDNCNGSVDDGLTFQNYFVDGDGDGYGAGAALSSCQPVAGRVTNNSDCNDGNASVKPSASEQCNNVDDNCNALVDDGLTFTEYYLDGDGDGFGAAGGSAVSACAPVVGRVTDHTDCDDALSTVKPGATEVCNSRDDNCDGATDEGLTFTNYYPDVDLDGYGNSSAPAQSACAPMSGRVTDHTDCNDNNSTVHPGAAETCNLVDDNCDGQVDNGTVTQSYYPDLDGDGYGATGSTGITSCSPVSGRVTNNLDCNDNNFSIKPTASEACNAVDDNCNGSTDEGLTFLSYYPDLDSDGFGASGSTAQSSCSPLSGKVTNNSDCNDSSSAIKPGATETCNSIDDNCNGTVDEGLPTQSYYADTDSDGFGAVSSAAVVSCKAVTGRVTNNGDCNDANSNIRPGAAELCNNLDDNCSGQVDEGNPGGSGGCVTGQAGVCGAGTVTCQSGALSCVGNVLAGAESCNGLDDDCDGSADEDFADKGQPCAVGLGVCNRSGTNVCNSAGTATECSVTPGAPTASACDGLDNNCDGVVDEPVLTSTTNVSTTVGWKDLEVRPYYFSSSGCQGGAVGSGTDALAGAGLLMGGGAVGLFYQPLNTAGEPIGALGSVASAFEYSDVDMAQAGDGFIVAGLYKNPGSGLFNEIDVYYQDAVTGVRRAFLFSQFNTGATNHNLDSLRVLRDNGRRVSVVWREEGVGYYIARWEACPNGSGGWELRPPGCAAGVTSRLLIIGAGASKGIAADSNHVDWGTVQTCEPVANLRTLGFAYNTAPETLAYFTLDESGATGSADFPVYSTSAPLTLEEPEITYYQSGGDQWAVAFITRDPTTNPPEADFNYWLTSAATWHYAYLAFGQENGVGSILRPRLSATSSSIWLSALRYWPDGSGFKQQVMTRTLDFGGNKLPASSSVEISATSGACSGAAACRPGNKDGFTQWASFGRVYYSASGSSPTGAYASAMSCN